jgi:hypothetical protein
MSATPDRRRLLAGRARRVTRIRRRVAAGTLAAFVMAWSVIAWTGSMGAEATSASASTTAATKATPNQDEGTPYQDEPAPVTTQQS